MKSSCDRVRASILFLLRRDTALMEGGLAFNALINTQLVNSVYDGKSLAPFTDSALRLLTWPKELWVFAWALLGVSTVLLLGVRLHSEWRGEKCRYLSASERLAFAATLLWATLMIAVWTAQQPAIVVVRYASPALFSLIVYLALAVRQREQCGDDKWHTIALNKLEHLATIEQDIAQQQTEFRQNWQTSGPAPQ